jgi:hypothetical protein
VTYAEAAALVRTNEAALAFVTADDHHTEHCRAVRRHSHSDSCFCDLVMHVAAIIEAERKRVRR